MNAGKLLILLLFIMVLVWYTAIWSLVIKVRGDTDISDFTMETIQNGGDCLRKSTADDRLLVHYVIKIHGTDNVIESRTTADSPYIVHLGQFVDIPTLERGLYDMCEQESRSMVVPPLLGYGVQDSLTKYGNYVPGNSTLQYEVTLVKIFSREETKAETDTTDQVKPTEGHTEKEEGVKFAAGDETKDQASDPAEGATLSEEVTTKQKDKKIVENMMGDAIDAVFNKNAGGLGDMAKQMLGGVLGGGGGGGGGGAGGMAGLVGKLAGAMGNGGAGGGGDGMAGLVGKLAGAMGGGGGGGMEGLMGQLAGALGKGGEGGTGDLMSKLSGMMGEGAGNKDGLASLMSQFGGGDGAGLMDLMGQLNGGSNGLSLGKVNEAISKMIQKSKERKNRRKTEL